MNKIYFNKSNHSISFVNFSAGNASQSLIWPTLCIMLTESLFCWQ